MFVSGYNVPDSINAICLFLYIVDHWVKIEQSVGPVYSMSIFIVYSYIIICFVVLALQQLWLWLTKLISDLHVGDR